MHQCEAITRKGTPCPIETEHATADGRWLCHLHHPELTFQQQQAAAQAAKAERARVAAAERQAERAAAMERKAAALARAVKRLPSGPPLTQAERWALARQGKQPRELREQQAHHAPATHPDHPDQCEAIAKATGRRCRKRKAQRAPDGRLLCDSHRTEKAQQHERHQQQQRQQVEAERARIAVRRGITPEQAKRDRAKRNAHRQAERHQRRRDRAVVEHQQRELAARRAEQQHQQQQAPA